MSRYDAISGLVIFFVSAVIIMASRSYPLGSLSQPGPGFLPLWCGVIMAFLSSVILIRTLRANRKKARAEERESFFTDRWLKVVLVLAALFAYSFLLELAGFFAANFIIILFLLKVIYSEKWRVALLEAATGALCTYLLFEVWLKLNLPKGLLVEFLFK